MRGAARRREWLVRVSIDRSYFCQCIDSSRWLQLAVDARARRLDLSSWRLAPQGPIHIVVADARARVTQWGAVSPFVGSVARVTRIFYELTITYNAPVHC